MRESPPNRQTGGSMGDRPSVMDDEMRSVRPCKERRDDSATAACWPCEMETVIAENKPPIRYRVHWGNWMIGRDVHVFITGRESDGN